MFTDKTKAVVWGMQTRAVQGMLDFDHVCSRKEPSVVAMVYPMSGDHKQKFYWGHKVRSAPKGTVLAETLVVTEVTG